MSVTPFRIDIPQADLDDLRGRLARTRWPDAVDGAGWDYGTNREYLQELVNFWGNGFDWRAQEKALNRFAHFRTEVDGYGVHFIHERGKGPYPIPLVLTHGWPDSFYRMVKIIPMLTDPARFGGDPADAFDVVVPSLPGYGFSDRPGERGFSSSRVAELWVRLMRDELGYRRFGAHGGDMGGSVALDLALTHPDALLGMHLTDVPYLTMVRFVPPASDLSEAEQAYKGSSGDNRKAPTPCCNRPGRSRWRMASTTPRRGWQPGSSKSSGLGAIAMAMSSGASRRMSCSRTSPCIGSRRLSTRRSGSIMRRCMIRLPRTRASGPRCRPRSPSSRTTWCSRRANGRIAFFQVERWTEMPRGGHFAAMEEPELLVDDIRAAFRPWR